MAKTRRNPPRQPGTKSARGPGPRPAADQGERRRPAPQKGRVAIKKNPEAGRKGLETSKNPVPTSKKPPAPTGLRLPPTLINTWRQALIGAARLPRGFRQADALQLNAAETLAVIIRQEAAAVGDLWQVFNRERSALTRNLLGVKPAAVAYLAGFHLSNAARAYLLLSRADSRWQLGKALAAITAALPPGQLLAWHDLGCGTGAVSQAGMEFLRLAGVPATKVRLHLYDAVGTLLDLARTLFDHEASGLSVASHRVALEKLAPERLMSADADAAPRVYSLGYVWNELANNPAARQRLLKLFFREAESDVPSLLVILEPATEPLAKAAMHLRDQLVDGGWRNLYPCPAGAAACPMLRAGGDWCFSDGEWQRPTEITTLDRRLGMDRSRLTGTMLLFANKALFASLQGSAPRGVIVGKPTLAPAGKPGRGARPRPEFGKSPDFEYLVCQGDKLIKTTPVPGAPIRARGDNS